MSMRTTILAWSLAIAMLGAVPMVGAAEPTDPVEESQEYVEECQDEFHWPPPQEKNTICGKLAEAYYELTPWGATASASEVCVGGYTDADVQVCAELKIGPDYVRDCLQEFTYPAPTNPDTVCGKLAQIYGDLTEPSGAPA
jgi:hypothetical protein